MANLVGVNADTLQQFAVERERRKDQPLRVPADRRAEGGCQAERKYDIVRRG